MRKWSKEATAADSHEMFRQCMQPMSMMPETP